MTDDKRNYIIEDNLSFAWGKVLSLFLEKGVQEVNPLFVTVKNIDNNIPKEDLVVREALDKLLVESKKHNCHTVANTIFPKSLWNPNKDRKVLFDRYKRIHPQIIMYDKLGKRCGRYFDRLIRHGDDDINQLDFIITTCMDKGNKRRSAYQASIIDPKIDHSNQPQKGFPCLQQVSFAPLTGGRLSVTGYYPYQYIFDRAYGNYLGLCWLGHFVAHELGLKLSEMTCIAGITKLGSIGKTNKNLTDLHNLINKSIKENGDTTEV